MFPSNREIWKRIDGYANYEVSNFGRVCNATTERMLKANLGGSGYLNVGLSKNVKSKTHNIHKLVAHEWLDNPDSKRRVDHTDGNKTNNHCENLKYATHLENSMNRKNRSNTSSEYKGGCFYKKKNKWQTHVSIHGKFTHMGLFEHEKEAAIAYNAAATEHYGEFAKLNEFSD